MEKSEKEQLLSYLEEILSFESSKLVGKCLKRWEIFFPKDSNHLDNNTLQIHDILKRDLKELIYEFSRDLKDIFYAYSKGLEKSYFIIKKEKE